jgi:hypothetical protein
MADYVPLTPAEIARRARVPENDPNYVNNPLAALLAPLAVYGTGMGPEVAAALKYGATQGAPALGRAAAETPAIVSKAIDAVRAAKSMPAKEMVRMQSGQMRNLAASAPTIVRTADGQIIKLTAGEAVPEGATVLNTVEAPVGKMIAGTAVGVGTPAILAHEVSGRSPQDTAAASTTPPTMAQGSTQGIGQDASNLDQALGDIYSPQGYASRFPDTSAGASASNAPSPMSFDQQSRFPSAYHPQQYDAGNAPATASSTKAPERSAPRAQSPDQSQDNIVTKALNAVRNIGGGDQYQSTGKKVMQDGKINWGDADSPADFFRASKALQENQPSTSSEDGMKRGGSVGRTNRHAEHTAILHKALEIIHALAHRK